jgi:uncharacterized membrane protein
MEDNQSMLPASTPSAVPVQTEPKSNRTPLIIGGIAVVVVVLLIIAGIVWLAYQPLDTTGRIRDIFIIFMALEFLVVGVALIVLMVQLATLINLLQNEVRPILTTTSETVNTLRGTAVFLSDNLVQPVMKLNEYLAGIKRLLDLLHLVR